MKIPSEVFPDSDVVDGVGPDERHLWLAGSIRLLALLAAWFVACAAINACNLASGAFANGRCKGARK